jgi:hypothetical protein
MAITLARGDFRARLSTSLNSIRSEDPEHLIGASLFPGNTA